MVTVFLAPSQASGQLLESYDEDGLILVEVQLREGDGLYFSGLFRDLVDFMNVRDEGGREGGRRGTTMHTSKGWSTPS